MGVACNEGDLVGVERRALLSLQVVYLLLALGYLLASCIQLKSGGPQFSKAAPLPNIALFRAIGFACLSGSTGRVRPSAWP